MNFIELTDSEFNTPIYVNIEMICAFYVEYYDGYTTLKLNNGISYSILEKTEKVLEMIDNALHESNKK